MRHVSGHEDDLAGACRDLLPADHEFRSTVEHVDERIERRVAGHAAETIADGTIKVRGEELDLSVAGQLLEGSFEFTKAADTINARTYATFEAYIPVALGYLALTIPISLVAARLERRFRYET